jgi:nucleotide-binding universal stress UspA family protein
MYRTILVPLDGSRFAEHALPPAIALARHSGAEMHLVTVSTPLAEISAEGVAFSSGELEGELEARYSAYLASVAERVRQLGATVRHEVLQGEVAECLCTEAEKSASLIAMATHGRGSFERFWLGSVADEVIRNVTRPVLLVRPGEDEPSLDAEPKLNPVLVALDGTPESEAVLPHAMALASLSPGAEVILMRALSGLPQASEKPDVPEARREAESLLSRLQKVQHLLSRQAEEYLEHAAAPLRARGVNVRCRVVAEDQPAEAILREANEASAGLIALETRGRAGLSRFFLGSVADKVIRAATIPVLVHRSAG